SRPRRPDERRESRRHRCSSGTARRRIRGGGHHASRRRSVRQLDLPQCRATRVETRPAQDARGADRHRSPGADAHGGMMAKIATGLLVASCLSGCGKPVNEPLMSTHLPDPPVAAKKPHATTVHGRTLTDDYFWLRERSDPNVTTYLKAEDEYAAAVMKPTAALHQSLFQP